MKNIAIVCAMLCLVAVAWFAGAAEEQDRPPGVEAKDWVAVSKGLGLVLVPATKPGTLPIQPGGLLLMPSAAGYFMARTGDGPWRRVVIIDPIKGPGSAG